MERESSKENVEWFEDGMNNSTDHEQQQHDLDDDDDDDDDDGIFGRPIAANDGGECLRKTISRLKRKISSLPLPRNPFNRSKISTTRLAIEVNSKRIMDEDTNDTDDAFKQPGQPGRNKFDDDDDAFNDEFFGDFNSEDNNGANNNNINDDGFSDDFGDFESSRQSVEAAAPLRTRH